MHSSDSNQLADIQRQLNDLRQENQQLKQQLNDITNSDVLPDDAELQQLIKELEAEGFGEMVSEQEMKDQLIVLLDELEDMIHAMNKGTGMGMRIPPKLYEIKNTLKSPTK